jgi:glycosyltransferase involved in cell wall biosynthesis
VQPIRPTEPKDSSELGRDLATHPYHVCMLFPSHALTDHLPIGDGLVAFGFISELARRGHRLHVIAQRIEIEQPLPPNVTIHLVVAKKRSIAARLRFIFRSRAIVRRLQAVERIDLVQQLNPVSHGMSLGMIGLHVPIVLGTFVGNWPPEALGQQTLVAKALRPLRGFARFVLSRLQERFASAFLVTTPSALSGFNLTESVLERVYRLPHGIDIRAFSQLPPVADVRKTILFLSSVRRKKGIFTLLEAFEMVHRALPDATLEIAGDGDALRDVERYVSTMSSARQVRFLGRVKRDAVPDLMARSSVYCLPSVGEPYATTVIEAMACGKPIVVANSGGLRDMVSDEGGRRVQPGNAKELATALIEILRSPSLQLKMGAHNRNVAEREYDWPCVIKQLEDVYERVLMHGASGEKPNATSASDPPPTNDGRIGRRSRSIRQATPK